MKNKKGQLGVIEAKFFLIGFIIGIILTMALIFLINKDIIPLPFSLGFLCPPCAG